MARTAGLPRDSAPRFGQSRRPAHVTRSCPTALGPVGYVSYEGYHYLTNRASFMIIFGGVNIYPQEIENELIMHPKVEDVTVIGVPHQASSTSAMRTSTSKSALFTAPDCAVGLSHEAKVHEALLRHLFRL